MARHMQKRSRKFHHSTPRQPCPAVSVIIPMYNVEKYVGECLDSILAQTFTNFEVIVVDDCSTDSSCAIVENYIPKFSGRLNLYHMEKNSGGCAMPRNKGIMLSRGEYVWFVDADDLLTKTALQELYTLAKDYDADVIYCEKFYEINADGSGIHINKSVNQSVLTDDKPVFETEDMAERVQKILQGKYRVQQFYKFTKRILIFEHKIFFPYVCPSEDDIVTYGLLFYAKKFLRVPNTVYIHRLSENSIMRKKKTPQQNITFWTNPVILGVKALDKLMSKHEFFQQNPPYRYVVLERFITVEFSCFLNDSFQLPPFDIYETIKQEFGDKLGEQDVLISALCTILNTQQKIMAIDQQKFNEFAAQAQEQVKKFNQFATQAQARIAELEAQLKTK